MIQLTVVDGPRESGKSTLIRSLAAATPPSEFFMVYDIIREMKAPHLLDRLRGKNNNLFIENDPDDIAAVFVAELIVQKVLPPDTPLRFITIEQRASIL